MKCLLSGKMRQNILAPAIQVKPLTATVLQVFLELSSPVNYAAGQYLEVVMADGKQVPLSIANAPLGSRQIELHIRHTPENALNMKLVSEIQTQGALQIVLPFGECTHLSLKPNIPVIFMARGSGFAPIKAIIEQLLADGSTLPMHLYWGSRNLGDHYLDELPKSWAEHVETFDYTPLLCPDDLSADVSLKWAGRTGDLIDTIAMDHYPDLEHYQVLAAGPFDMIFKARNVFQAQGLNAENMYADAFAFQIAVDKN
jgi:CDP-4-dehydro-6-deoxyglucose reductase